MKHPLVFRVFNRLSILFRIVSLECQIVRKVVVSRKLSHLPDYPSSDATPDQFFDLTIKGAQRNYSILHSFTNSEKTTAIPLADWTLTQKQELVSEKLRLLFNQNGSDKGDSHGYHRVYATLMNPSSMNNFRIMEIGLGTNYIDTASNMGRFGVPGASLRSWRDFDSTIEVVGADIDSRILFQEERIATHQLDQTDDSSWQRLDLVLRGQTFDLIIDDGLHSPLANLLTVKNLLPKLHAGGHMVIEDVNINALPLWDLFFQLTKTELNASLVKADKAYMIILSKI
jgi:hypothetical protein